MLDIHPDKIPTSLKLGQLICFRYRNIGRAIGITMLYRQERSLLHSIPIRIILCFNLIYPMIQSICRFAVLEYISALIISDDYIRYIIMFDGWMDGCYLNWKYTPAQILTPLPTGGDNYVGIILSGVPHGAWSRPEWTSIWPQNTHQGMDSTC